MFYVEESRSKERLLVYAVHKSGPSDDQTKFLIWKDGAWKWIWVAGYVPVLAEPPA
jgi:hypothetical protein